MPLHVEIVTPTRAVYSGEASEVVLPAWEGELGVYADHDPLLTLLRAGRAIVIGPEGTTEYIVGRGFAEIGADHVTMLTDSCQLISDVDVDRAHADMERAEQQMEEVEPDTEKYRVAEATAEHAMARLDNLP